MYHEKVRAARALLLLCASCRLVSGLDQLSVEDAQSPAIDATGGDASDAASDDVDQPDVADASATDAPAEVSSALQISCGNKVCNASEGEVCCAPPDGGATSCDKQTCPANENNLQLGCDQSSDCTDAAAPLCCFGGITTTTSPTTQCRAAFQCGVVVCVLGSKVPCKSSGTCVPYDAGDYSVSLGRCN